MLVLAGVKTPTKSAQIADKLGSSAGFISQALNPLVKAGFLGSAAGPKGGYYLEANINKISMLEVIEVIHGPIDNGICVVSGSKCTEESPCAMHFPWSKARGVLVQTLADIPLAQLSKEIPVDLKKGVPTRSK